MAKWIYHGKSAAGKDITGEMVGSREEVEALLRKKRVDRVNESEKTFFNLYAQDMWISPDPARQFASPYSYCPNLLNSFDPNDKNVFLLSARNGAGWVGYNAMYVVHLSLL